MTTYIVGQILYIVPEGKAQLVPVQVIEEITKKTVNGSEVAYIIKWNGQTADLKAVKGEVFETPEKAKNVLTTRSRQAIEQMVEKAVSKAAAWYVGVPEKTEEPDIMEALTTDDDGAHVLELPDGTKARVRMPNVKQ